MEWALRILSIPLKKAAGLWLWGDVGVGKTHISIGVAKYFKDREVLFAQDLCKLRGGSLDKYDVFILEDVNRLYGSGDVFRAIVLHAFNKGKIVLVTSNTEYSTILPQAFITEEYELPRFNDRIRNMFKILNLDGIGHRSSSYWWDQ